MMAIARWRWSIILLIWSLCDTTTVDAFVNPSFVVSSPSFVKSSSDVSVAVVISDPLTGLRATGGSGNDETITSGGGGNFLGNLLKTATGGGGGGGGDGGAGNAATKRYLDELRGRVERINAWEEQIEELGDDELAAKTDEFRQRLASGEDVNGPILEEAFAVVREASWRVLEQRHYDVQLIGGMILHDGRLAEMATGEGKTLVSTLPCYLNALVPLPGSNKKKTSTSFVITANDYLARRDAEKMGQIHRFLGLTVGLVQAGMDVPSRREAYACDVTYVTNSELGFDYLRDHLALDPRGTVLISSPSSDDSASDDVASPFDGFCVVDEADSVLIDEARTPLVVSKREAAPADRYSTARTLAEALTADVHYTVDLKNKNVVMNERGYRESENALGIQSLFEPTKGTGQAWAPYIQNALKAKELFRKDIEYSVIVDKETGNPSGVGIVDSYTGRVMDGRRWADGLHQAIEAMEDISVSDQSVAVAKLTYQSLFRQFRDGSNGKLSGMTGTASTDAEELMEVYGLLTVPVPTALPVARRDYPDVAFKTRAAADRALVREVLAAREMDRPCLVGTTSVERSEAVVNLLRTELGLENDDDSVQLLNASPDKAAKESQIIAQAGRAGTVTVATNMAGRGTDILLGGDPSLMARLKLRSVLLDQCPGLLQEGQVAPPSPSQSYYPVDLADESNEEAKAVMAIVEEAIRTIQLYQKQREQPMTAIELEEFLTMVTDTTEAPEDPIHIMRTRDAVEALKTLYRTETSAQAERVRGNGGLYVMGTERHGSRRVDRQLRGRAGRQGDPGSSRFFLSFQDEMFRVFGADSLDKMLEAFRVSEDMPVDAPQIADAMDKVQFAVEEKDREVRSSVLAFDEVLDGQRKVVYARRNDILFAPADNGDTCLEYFRTYHKETVEDLVRAQTTTNKDANAKTSEDRGDRKIVGVVDIDGLWTKVEQFFPLVVAGSDQTTTTLLERLRAAMDTPEQVVALLIQAVDGTFATVTAHIDHDAASAGRGSGAMARTARYLTLVSMDTAWSGHLRDMENLKEAAILRSKYQGRDPVEEYSGLALQLFEGLVRKMRLDAVYSLWQHLNMQQQAAAASSQNAQAVV